VHIPLCSCFVLLLVLLLLLPPRLTVGHVAGARRCRPIHLAWGTGRGWLALCSSTSGGGGSDSDRRARDDAETQSHPSAMPREQQQQVGRTAHPVSRGQATTDFPG